MAMSQNTDFEVEEMVSDSQLLETSQSLEEEERRAVVKEAQDKGEWCKDLDANVYLYIATE